MPKWTCPSCGGQIAISSIKPADGKTRVPHPICGDCIVTMEFSR